VPCAFSGCEKNAVARGYCNGHDQQIKRGTELRPLGWRPPRKQATCLADACDLFAERRGWCGTHYVQYRRSGVTRGIRVSSGRYIDPAGYVRVRRPGHPEARDKGSWGIEHRMVMADLLGRPLLRDESVHHKNGDRADNRPENLELWSRWQPPGQRVVDKVAYAKELLALYEPAALASK
jgi:hypothetical protein